MLANQGPFDAVNGVNDPPHPCEFLIRQRRERAHSQLQLSVAELI